MVMRSITIPIEFKGKGSGGSRGGWGTSYVYASTRTARLSPTSADA